MAEINSGLMKFSDDQKVYVAIDEDGNVEKAVIIDGAGNERSIGTEVYSLTGVIAEAYDADSTYAVGDYVMHDNELFRCTTAIETAEAWNAAHWTKVSLADDMAEANNDIVNLGAAVSVNTENIEDIESVVEMITPPGYNLLLNAESGRGYYYASGSKIIYAESATYTYYIVKAQKNTDYLVSSGSGARFWILTDDDDTVIRSGSYINPNDCINTGEATKIWLSMYTTDVTKILVEGYNGNQYAIQKPGFLNEVSMLLQSRRYACALPRNKITLTQGIDETFYFENMVSLNPDLLNINCQLGGNPFDSKVEGGISVDTSNTVNSTNGYRVKIFDDGMNLIDTIVLKPFVIKALNLSNCSALVIGDSQVAAGTMTGDMLTAFTTAEKILTLLGTQGISPNLHEGRSGWSAKDYCTKANISTVNNPFWNPTTEKFDFSKYMTDQDYSSVDFVIINLGGNDLYNADPDDDEKITQTVGYILEIIDSILAFNNNQKIILNLAPATTSKLSDARNYRWAVKNVYARYNNIMQVLSLKYANTVRTSYTHLIVDPANDLADHIHENSTGYGKMANELVNQINIWQNS